MLNFENRAHFASITAIIPPQTDEQYFSLNEKKYISLLTPMLHSVAKSQTGPINVYLFPGSTAATALISRLHENPDSCLKILHFISAKRD